MRQSCPTDEIASAVLRSTGVILRSTAILFTLAGLSLTAACHSNPPKETPAPQPTEAEIAMHKHAQDSVDAITRATADSAARAQQEALAIRAHDDSVARAMAATEAAARDAAALVSQTNTALRTELGVMVHFDVAKSQLADEDRAALDRKVAILNANPSVHLQITGATDDRGSDQYNQALGKRRAAAVTKYLVEKGIDVARLEPISTGEKSPIDTGNNEAAWTQNRRAEFVIVGGDSPLASN